MNISKYIAYAAVFAAITATSQLSAAVVNITQGSTSGYTMTDGNTYVVQNSVSFSNSTAGGSGMSVADGATVVLYIPTNVTLTAVGANGSGQTGGGAGILVPETSTLVLTGEGTICATGGNAGNGGNGANGKKGTISKITSDHTEYNEYGAYIVYSPGGTGESGAGGMGGAGGGGAGAGIGGSGGFGGHGGEAGAAVIRNGVGYNYFSKDGNDGGAGIIGTTSSGMGNCYCLGRVTIVATCGENGAAGTAGSKADGVFKTYSSSYYFAACGGGGGGGGGAGGIPTMAIGAGGSGGGGGGGGGSGAAACRFDQSANSQPLTNANGGGGNGGGSIALNGVTGEARRSTKCGSYPYTTFYGGEGGAAGAAGTEGEAGILYVSSTATVNVNRTTTWANTHQAAQYTITFNANGGEFFSSESSTVATLGCTMPTIAIPTRTGYVFVGYFTSADGGGKQYYTASGASARTWDGTSDTTLYAKWWRPDAPIITPAGGVVVSWPLSVTMSCATDGATIHYTTDGSEPMEASAVYRRFRITERTTVKAVAIKNGVASEVAVAEFAAGQCADPVITPADGTEFEHVGLQVSIAWSGEDGVLRYTTDGSDPTAESPIYGGPFTIDDSTVVKAKAFGDQYFDSAVVTANLTRVWVNVATPAIAAASSFTGAETKVALSCATPGATIRYTLNGNDPNSHSTRYTGPFYVADSCTVKAYATCHDYLDSAVATQSIEKVWGIGDTMGAPDHAFSTGGDLPFVRVTDSTAPLGESMKSGAITHNQTSTLSTTVMGPGTISFQWKTSCEDSGGQYDWDHAEFSLDGTVVARLDGESGWQTVSQAIAGDGSHALLWKYVKDDVESEGEDCCWVADYQWTSAYTATQTTPAPVPYAWLRGFFPHTPDEYDAYESAAKEDAANGQNTVWECYVAGLNPTEETAAFRTVISIGADGEPVIGWEPRLSAEEEAKRTYTIYGRETLEDGEWTTPTNAASRFFRVKVEMP